jgi:hypothetical protein
MGTPGGLKESGADKALRDLFASEGAFVAPDGLDTRIMERLAPAPAKEKALLPRWTWILLAAVFVLPFFIPYQSTFKLPDISKWIPEFHLASGPSWLLPALAAAIALLALEVWLIRRRSTTAHS